MIRINLTGDYKLSKPSGNTATELYQLDALLGALRGSVESDGDLFLKSVAELTGRFKRTKFTNVALQITSTLSGSTLTHTFKLVDI